MIRVGRVRYSTALRASKSELTPIYSPAIALLLISREIVIMSHMIPGRLVIRSSIAVVVLAIFCGCSTPHHPLSSASPPTNMPVGSGQTMNAALKPPGSALICLSRPPLSRRRSW
jgi:hypothetical protein